MLNRKIWTLSYKPEKHSDLIGARILGQRSGEAGFLRSELVVFVLDPVVLRGTVEIVRGYGGVRFAGGCSRRRPLVRRRLVGFGDIIVRDVERTYSIFEAEIGRKLSVGF